MTGKTQKIKRRFILALTILLVVTLAYALGWTSLFTVKHVRVVGAPTTSQSLLIRESIKVGEKMARLETRAVSNSLRKYTWLDHAQISRDWLKGSVTIRVWTRTPVAVFRNHLIDSNGVLFDLPNDQIPHLPQITASKIAPAKFALELLLDFPTNFRAEIIDVRAQGSHTAILTVRTTLLSPSRNVNVIWGDLTDTDLKIRVFNALLSLPENAKVQTINVSAPHAPIVK
ncbi:MAG TPA: FtsQ-type POTRA domain-containing protein [Candidatus Paceibacterota bacterium]|nr:FtsQ-type POTRA domain-containing protein [Candidatus Paceibacterota bacterium]